MKVLLLAPPWGEIYGSFRGLTRRLNLNPPLNLAYLAASAARAGHDVKIADLEFLPRRKEVLHRLIEENAPDVVGVTVTSPMFPTVTRIVRLLKTSGVPVILGGPHVTIARNEVFSACPEADFALAGEAEQSFTDLLSALDRGEDPGSIPGLMRPGDATPFAEPPTLAPDLDALPDPIYPGIDFSNYTWSVKGRKKVPAQTIITSRGCPYDCVFCAVQNLTGRAVRFRDVARVADEMERAVKTSPVRHFVFVDDVLTLKKTRIHDLCEILSGKNLPVTWEGDTRADLVDGELLQTMARAGCTRINFGIESGSQEVLDGLKKNISLSRVADAFRLAKKAGMDTRGTAMIGNPGDTRQTIRATVDFLRELSDLDQPYLSIAQPYPGTELSRIALSGKSNLSLAEEGLDGMRRYGSAVMHVGDISPKEMIAIQRRALLKIYARPRRVLYNLFRAHPADTAALALGFFRSVLLPWKTRRDQIPFSS